MGNPLHGAPGVCGVVPDYAQALYRARNRQAGGRGASWSELAAMGVTGVTFTDKAEPSLKKAITDLKLAA